MPAAPKPENEHTRVAMLQALGILDTPPEQDYDDIVRIAAAICGTSNALVSLVDADRQWFKARIGVEPQQTPLDTSFCAHAILEPDAVLLVPDATVDSRFSDMALVQDGTIAFYAGAPVIAGDAPVGTVCVFDAAQHAPDAGQLEALRALARQVGRLIEMRRLATMLDVQRREREWYERTLARHHAAGAALDPEAALQFDVVTGLPGTRAFLELLDATLAHEVPAGQPMQVALVEMDARDAIEDMAGAGERDRLLMQLALLLRTSQGLHGQMARVGDAFAVLLAMPLVQARAQCELVRVLVSGDAAPFPITISIGLAEARRTDSAGSLFQRAAVALAQARQTGDRVVTATSADDAGRVLT